METKKIGSTNYVDQAFTIYMCGYDSECNMHTNNITFAQKFMRGINSAV